MKISFLCLVLMFPTGAGAAMEWDVSSPDGKLAAQVHLDEDGRLAYVLLRDSVPVIRPSPLGIHLAHTRFDTGLEETGPAQTLDVSDEYELPTGKRRHNSYSAREMRLGFRNPDGHVLRLDLRLSNDGLAYRYAFPGEPDTKYQVMAELSGIHFLDDTRAWLQPKANAKTGWSRTNPSYEEDYLQDVPVGTPSPTESGWVYPALFRHGDTWILLSETGMDGRYPGTNLAQHSEDGLYRVRFPQPVEVVTGGALLPESKEAFHTPWRLVMAGSLETLTESTLGTDLAVPGRIADASFVQPGIAAWSWGVLKDDSVDYDVQKAFIDYAADMNWRYVLVDVEWDQRIGYDRIAELADYAASKDVSLLLWYNSSGDWNDTVYSPKSKLLNRDERRAEFARLRAMGIAGVKVDFFAGDGASVIRYYLDILEDAADFGLVVNTHGSTLPRGMQRTYPNYLTSEAVKGFEFLTFEQANTDREATHVAMLPFTRNVFDPMDFTPTVLGEIPGRERRTSNGFQLALPVLFTSGIQHIVTTPEQMEPMPEFVKDYLRALPVQWDETRLIEGYPGRYAVIARRAGTRWYVAGVNAEAETREFQPDLEFTGATRGELITDGADWRQPAIREFKTGEAPVALPHGTGFVMILEP